jgi:acetyl esterase/lipase
MKFFLTLLVGSIAGSASAANDVTAPVEPRAYTYRVVDGDSLAAFAFHPTRREGKPAPAILLFHGGGWAAGSPECAIGTDCGPLN